MCISVVSARNTSTRETDIYVTLGSNSRPGVGWMAVGLGGQMARSLMFLTISDRQKSEYIATLQARNAVSHEVDMKFSVRTAS